MGDQALYLPWNDLRARQVAHFHGERIVIGVRAEALTPVPGQPAATSCAAGSATWSTTATSRSPSSTSARPP